MNSQAVEIPKRYKPLLPLVPVQYRISSETSITIYCILLQNTQKKIYTQYVIHFKILVYQT